MDKKKYISDEAIIQEVSDNYSLICHDPKTYSCPNCILLDNQEQLLVDYTIMHHDNIGSTVKVSPIKECFGHDESDDTLIASIIEETPIKEASGFNDTFE